MHAISAGQIQGDENAHRQVSKAPGADPLTTMVELGLVISVVIPTLNEAENLPHVLTRMPPCVGEVIIVDGNSTDDTVAVALEILPDARIVQQSGRGKGNALACGFAAARGQVIVMLDADGSTDPGEIPAFVEPLLDGADFVKGSRFIDGGGSTDITGIRHLGNRFLNTAHNTLYGTHYTDLCYGFNAFRADCLDDLHVTCDGFEVETWLHARAARANLSVVEVPSIEHDRMFGESNLSAVRDGTRVLRTIVRERVRRAIPTDARGSWRPEFRELSEAQDGERCTASGRRRVLSAA